MPSILPSTPTHSSRRPPTLIYSYRLLITPFYSYLLLFTPSNLYLLAPSSIYSHFFHRFLQSFFNTLLNFHFTTLYILKKKCTKPYPHTIISTCTRFHLVLPTLVQSDLLTLILTHCHPLVLAPI